MGLVLPARPCGSIAALFAWTGRAPQLDSEQFYAHIQRERPYLE